MKKIKYFVVAFVVICLFIPLANAQASNPLDPTFSHIFEYINGSVTAIAKQPDGKILVGGNFTTVNTTSRNSLARFNADGTLDESFNANASIATFATGIRAIVVLPDGKILVGGHFLTDFNTFSSRGIARLNSNGTEDTSFTGAVNSAVFAVAVQSDGKIFIGGAFSTVNGVSRFGLARLNTDGSLDSSFTFAIRTVFALALQPDGNLLVGGNFTSTSPNVINRIVKLSPTGEVNTAFIANAGADNTVYSIKLQSDGKIVLGGLFTVVNGASHNGLARLNADGSIDSGFNPSITGAASNTVESLDIDANGKILFGGNFTTVNGSSRSNIGRVNSDGTLDTSFAPTGANLPVRYVISESDGSILVGGDFQDFNGATKYKLAKLNADGSVNSSFNPAIYTYAGVEEMETQPDGKILIGGGFNYLDEIRYGAFARLNADGSVDTSFANYEQGQFLAPTVSDIEVQPDGKIIVAGLINLVSNPGTNYNIIRLNSDGTVDNTFTPVRANTYVVKVLPNGQILIGGNFLSVNGTSRSRLAKLNSDGSLDTSFNPNISAVTQATILDMFVRADGKIIIAGYFNSYNGTSKNNIALINADGTLDNSYTAAASDPVYSVAGLPNGSLLISGIFTTVNGTARNNVARLLADGELDNSFNPPSNLDIPFLIAKPYLDGKVIVTGEANYGSFPPNYVVILNADGSTNTVLQNSEWFHSSIYDVEVQDGGKVIFCGYFTQVGNVTRVGLARFNSLNFSRKGVFDFDGDGKTDLSIFRPAVGEWWYLRSSDGGNAAAQFGLGTDKITPGDFTGDGRTDIAFWRPSDGFWYILRSEDGSFFSFPFGTGGDIPAPADYDGDGKADAAVFRSSSGTWFILNSGGSGTSIVNFGAGGDKPVPADFDGDGKADIAIFRPSDGSWWYLQSSNSQFKVYRFGVSTDKPVQGDYTGDGKADLAVFRPVTGEWFIQRSEDNSYFSFPFGTNGDVPVPGDYDGDGRFDAAVFRPGNLTWYLNQTTAGVGIVTFGAAGDQPVPNAFVP